MSVTTVVANEEVQKIQAHLLPTILQTHGEQYGNRYAIQLAEVIVESGFTHAGLTEMNQSELFNALKSILSEEYPSSRKTILEAYSS